MISNGKVYFYWGLIKEFIVNVELEYNIGNIYSFSGLLKSKCTNNFQKI